MFAKELIGIVQEALDRKGSDNPLDRILVSAFVSTRSGGNKYQELFANPHFAEIRTLFARVLDPSRSGAEEAAAAILAYVEVPSNGPTICSSSASSAHEAGTSA
jgi:hypothetical protein